MGLFKKGVYTFLKGRQPACHTRGVASVYWIEYAVRNKNINFRPPAADVPFYKYFNLDVLVIFTLILYSLFYVVKTLFCLRKAKSSKESKKSKKV
jgi:hypothetical protein